jgi:PGF-pre-PGF domain-containing protein
MSLKNKVIALALGVLVTLVPSASALAVGYNGTVVSPQGDGITYTIVANSGDTLTLNNVGGQTNGQLAITFKNNVNGTIVIKPSAGLPTSASSAPSGTVATYYDVTLNGFSNADVTSSTWSFSTTKTFISNLGLTASNVFLVHYNGSSWDRLSTKQLSSDATNYNFSASVTSFSPFAIVAVPGLTNTGTPYLLLVGGGIAALVVIGGAYLLTRKRTSHKHSA